MSQNIVIDFLHNLTVRDQYVEYCIENGTKVTTYPWYIAFQVLWIIVATVSLGIVFRVYYVYVRSSKLHNNIQILLKFFLLSAVLINAIFIFYQSYQVMLSLTYEHPCEVFLQKHFYVCMNIVFGVSIELYLLSQAAMAMERVLATLYANGYEQMKALPAAVGITLSVLSSVIIEYCLYRNCSFFEPQISVLNSPPDVRDRFNNLLTFNFACSGVTTCIMVTLLVVNKKRQQRTIGNVSWRFQTEENIETTKMIAYVSFIQLMAYTMQSFGSLLLRKLEKIVPELSDQQVMKTLKLAIYVLPLSTALMSAVIEYCSYTTQARRKSKIQRAVNLKDEAQHYSNFLAEQWNQKSASSSTREMATSEQLMFPRRLWYFRDIVKRWLQ